MYQVFAGKSENVEAEFGSRAEEAFTIAEAIDYEVYAVRGFKTLEALHEGLKEYTGTETTVEIV